MESKTQKEKTETETEEKVIGGETESKRQWGINKWKEIQGERHKGRDRTGTDRKRHERKDNKGKGGGDREEEKTKRRDIRRIDRG